MVSYSFVGDKCLWKARSEEENANAFSQESQSAGVEIPRDITPTYLGNAESEVEKWPLVHLIRLLRFYAAHRCLWDVSCKDNRNRKLRQAAIADITSAMDIGVSREQVVQKINILRATYRYEKKRIKQRIRRGLGPCTKLKWFALADAFLRNVPKKGHKDEDPSNSDSDLEDTIVFTINPESLIPLDQEFSAEAESKDMSSDLTKSEIFSEDSQFYNAPLENQPREDLNFRNYLIKSQDIKNKSCHVQYAGKKKPWTLENTLLFLQLLENNIPLLENPVKFCEFPQILLESIAKEMNYEYKSIEKRWYILQKIFREEKQKILESPQYKPVYKWWPKAEKLFQTISNGNVTTADNKSEVATEFIYLTESEHQESNDVCDNEYENKFLQNPIPSVAPLSNMSEAMASLFHDNNNDDDILQESETNSLLSKENITTNSDKFVWHGLEEDLLEGKWSLKHSVKFLRLYGVHRCLWDLNDPDYRSRPLRNAAIEDIAASMGHGLTASYVAKKIKIFRITYMQQRKRLLEATEKGEKPEILLKWFPLADSFLRPHIGLRSIKSDAKELPQFDYQYVYANLNLIDPALLNDFRGKGTQNAIEIGNASDVMDVEGE